MSKSHKQQMKKPLSKAKYDPGSILLLTVLLFPSFISLVISKKETDIASFYSFCKIIFISFSYVDIHNLGSIKIGLYFYNYPFYYIHYPECTLFSKDSNYSQKPDEILKKFYASHLLWIHALYYKPVPNSNKNLHDWLK